MKILINRCYGGFGISDEALKLYKQKVPLYEYDNGYHIERTDPILIEIFEKKVVSLFQALFQIFSYKLYLIIVITI